MAAQPPTFDWQSQFTETMGLSPATSIQVYSGKNLPPWTDGAMPRISAFYGIAIYMYYKDHSPPHFHAIYGDHEATIDIQLTEIHDGTLPRRAKKLVLEWAAEHNEALRQNWELARVEQPLAQIPPLN